MNLYVILFILSSVLFSVQTQDLVNSDICGQSVSTPAIGVRTLTLDNDLSDENSGPDDVMELYRMPWMALLVYDNSRGFGQAPRQQFHCSGSVISQRYILTSARCVVNLKSTDTLKAVRLGEHDYNSTTDCGVSAGEETCAPSAVTIAIAETVPHPQYNRYTLHNDIALLRLEADIDFSSDAVKPICLPVGQAEKSRVFTNERMSVTGWGLANRGEKTYKLHKLDQAMVSNKVCNRKQNRRIVVSDKQMCYGGATAADSCHDDNGSPIMHNGLGEFENKAVQYGVRSYHLGCNTSAIPSVATKVGAYIDWILRTVRD